MKTVTLKTRDAYDLNLVLGAIVQEQSNSLDFKDVIRVQKEANRIASSIKEFTDSYEEIAKDRNQLVELAQKKISAFKEKEMKKAEENGVDTGYKERVDDYTKMAVDELQSQINRDLQPRFDALYKSSGDAEVSVEIEEDSLKAVVDNFEKYAKEKYTNKSKMIEVYEALTSAK